MHRIAFLALLTLSAAALPTWRGAAQLNPPPSTSRSTQGAAREGGDDVPVCRSSGGGTRTRANCEPEPVTLQTQMELKLSIEVPALPSTQCQATANTEYHQRNTIARVTSTLKIEDCAAASGDFTVAVRLKDESGENAALEFNETWQRNDDQDVTFTTDYPIGENSELVGVRIRGLSCTCADPPTETPAEPAQNE